jgi:queuine tRNA-ribosyltransferase
MDWDRPILTDSGGFQVVSLGDLRVVDEDGVTFRRTSTDRSTASRPSRRSASRRRSGRTSRSPSTSRSSRARPDAVVADATARTHRWAERSLAAHTRTDQAMFGIVQGGLDPICGKDPPGSSRRCRSTASASAGWRGRDTGRARRDPDVAVPALADDPRPRYLMGLGSPADLLEAVHRGVDLFDSVLPARVARNGQLWVPGGRLNIRNQRFLDDPAPIQGRLPCIALPAISRAPIWPICSGPRSCSRTVSRLVTT